MAHITRKLIVWGFLALGVIPIILLVGMHCLNFGFFGDSSNDGWLGFWGGYLGSIIAILGVGWTLSESKKNMNITLNNEKESQFRMARPFFHLDVNTNAGNNKKDKLIFSSSLTESEGIGEFSEYLANAKHYKYLSIDNLSGKRMMAVKVHLHYSEEINDKKIKDENFFLNLIRPDESAYLISKTTFENRQAFISIANGLYADYELYNPYENLEYAELFFTTELRERIRLVFDYINDESDSNLSKKFRYNKDKKMLENKTPKVDSYLNKHYSLGDFSETIKMSGH